MPQSSLENKKELTVADLYPQLTAEQQKEAEYYLLRYLAVVKRIFERIARENPNLLLELEKGARLRKKKNRHI
jgi:hypothetical protein